jgi:hypothetical protein
MKSRGFLAAFVLLFTLFGAIARGQFPTPSGPTAAGPTSPDSAVPAANGSDQPMAPGRRRLLRRPGKPSTAGMNGGKLRGNQERRALRRRGRLLHGQQ